MGSSKPRRSGSLVRVLGADVLLKTIKAIAAAIDAKSLFSRKHSDHVTELCVDIGVELGLPRERLDTLQLAAQIHDVGKIGTPETVLTKPGALTDDEWARILKHPAAGADFLAGIEELREVASIVRHHHERIDGQGYPDRLRGDGIPFLSRILAVADAFDAMTSRRPHRRPIGPLEALEELRVNAGRQFDADVVDAAVRVIERQQALAVGKKAA